jgi:uncharacterized membrane protein
MHIEILDKKGLREFGLITGGMFAGLFGLLLPWLFSFDFPLWPWIVAGILWGLALLIPNSLKRIYQGWMYFALVIGWINTRLLLAIVFFLIITPIGLFMRLFGKNPVKNKPSQSTSYRNLMLPRSPKHLERPF